MHGEVAAAGDRAHLEAIGGGLGGTDRALAAEVGEAWVRRYPGELTTEVLLHALEAVRDDPPTGRPDLSAREWTAVGAEHVGAYRRAVQLAGARSHATATAQRRRYSW